MMYIIDRFEGDIAVVETDSGHININRNEIEGDPHEGDVIVLKNDGGYAVDKAATKTRRDRIFEKITGKREKK